MNPVIIKVAVYSLMILLVISIIAFVSVLIYWLYKVFKKRREEKHSLNLLNAYKEKVTLAMEFIPHTPKERVHGSFKKWHEGEEERHSTEHVGEVSKMARKADTLFAQGNFDGAQELLLQALAGDQDNTDVLNKLALAYLNNKLYFKAETLYIKLIELGASSSAIFTNLGHALYYQGKLNLAKDAYEKAISLEKDKTYRYYYLAQVLYDMKDLQGALFLLKHIYEKEKNNREYWYTLSIFYEDLKDNENLKQSLNQLIRLEPFNKDHKRRLAGIE